MIKATMKSKKKAIIENDLVLIYVDNRPSFFARVEKIFPDVKPRWWRVKLLILQIPVFVATWILDDNQLRGDEFTMNGTPIKVEKVHIPQETKQQIPNKSEKSKARQSANQKARILSLKKEQEEN